MRTVNTIRSKLSPSLYHATLDLRKNLWQIFIQPLFEFTLPLYFHEEAATKKMKVQVCLRNSFKSFTSLKKTIKSELIEDLMGYNIDDRSRKLYNISSQKWNRRKEGKTFDSKSKEKNKDKDREERLTFNLCKDLPKSMIKYINMQTTLCPKCKMNNMITRCSKEHLEKTHDFKIIDEYEIINQIRILKGNNRRESQNSHKMFKRKERIELAESVIRSNIEKLKQFLGDIP